MSAPDLFSAVAPYLGSLPVGSQPVETSEAAADHKLFRGKGDLVKLRLNVLIFIAERPQDGATADEIAAAFGCTHNHSSPRVTELRKAGFLKRLDGKEGREKRKRWTRQGERAFVHIISPSGWSVVEKARRDFGKVISAVAR